jgi:DNA ligase (NAD+)
LEGWKERSAERFIKSLQESVKVGFDRVLYALGIRYVGEATARSIAGHFRNIDAIIDATVEDLLNVEDVGDVIAESVHDFFADAANRDIVARLKKAGLKFEMGAALTQVSSGLEGQTIVISGNFSISRDEMKALVMAHGGKNSGSVSGRTSFLLAGEKAGPEKLKKAESLGVKVISEDEFMDMIGAENEIAERVSEQSSPVEGEQLSLF